MPEATVKKNETQLIQQFVSNRNDKTLQHKQPDWRLYGCYCSFKLKSFIGQKGNLFVEVS